MLFNVALCVQLKQVNANIENCYILVAFFVRSYYAPVPSTVLELGAQTAVESTLACMKNF